MSLAAGASLAWYAMIEGMAQTPHMRDAVADEKRYSDGFSVPVRILSSLTIKSIAETQARWNTILSGSSFARID